VAVDTETVVVAEAVDMATVVEAVEVSTRNGKKLTDIKVEPKLHLFYF
jgi:hypothetical protein